MLHHFVAYLHVQSFVEKKNANFYQFFLEHIASADERNAMGLSYVVTIRPYRLQGNKIILVLLNLMNSLIDIRLR